MLAKDVRASDLLWLVGAAALLCWALLPYERLYEAERIIEEQGRPLVVYEDGVLVWVDKKLEVSGKFR